MEGEDDAASAPSTDANTPNPASDDAAAAAGEEDLGGKWAAHKLAEASGSHSDLPDIMINGKVQKVTPRDHSKWNETGSSAMDDHTFRKLDEEVFMANFWAKEWVLLLLAFVVLLFDVICCYLIYSAVQDNNRSSGGGPQLGEVPLLIGR